MTNQINSLNNISASKLIHGNLLNSEDIPADRRIEGLELLHSKWGLIKVKKSPGLQAIMEQIENTVIASCQSKGKCTRTLSLGKRNDLLALKSDVLFKKLADHFNTKSLFRDVVRIDSEIYIELQNQWEDEALLVLWIKCIVPKLGQTDRAPSSITAIRAWFSDISNAPLLEGITIVDLSSSWIKTVPSEICKLVNLESLYLKDNQISMLPEKLFSNNPNLTSLYLDNNEIFCLPENLFNNNPKLSIFFIDFNKISSLPENLLANCPMLISISVENNLISSLPENLFAACINLEGVYLRNNQILCLPENLLVSCPKLSFFDLKNNQITIFPKNLFAGCSQTPLIQLDQNPLLFILYKDDLTQNRYDYLIKCSEFHSYQCLSPFAGFVKLVAFEKLNKEKIQDAFNKLRKNDQNLIFKMLSFVSYSPSNSHKWIEHHAFDDMNLFCKALRKAISNKINSLPQKNKNKVDKKESDQIRYSQHNEINGVLNVLALIDAMEKQ